MIYFYVVPHHKMTKHTSTSKHGWHEYDDGCDEPTAGGAQTTLT